MSRKFNSDRSVEFAYHAVPLYYTSIKHANNNDKELVLIDDFKTHFIAAYRNMKLNKVGIHFVLKKEIKNGNSGFLFKGKFYSLRKKHGWVF
jgi:hypothetical protein